MKYSPEELYAWCLEQGYKKELVTAQYCNTRGFVARPLQGELIKKDNQYYYKAKLVNDYEIEEAIGHGTDEENRVLDKVAQHPEVMAVSIVQYDKKYRLFTTFAETEEERIESMDQKIIMVMFELLGIDTHGKVKQLVEESRMSMASKQAWTTVAEGLKKKREE